MGVGYQEYLVSVRGKLVRNMGYSQERGWVMIPQRSGGQQEMLRYMVVALLMVAGSEGMRMAKAPMAEMRLGGGMRGAMHSTPLTRRREDMLLLK